MLCRAATIGRIFSQVRAFDLIWGTFDTLREVTARAVP